MKVVIFVFLLLVSCQAQEERIEKIDVEKLIQTLPPLEKLTYDKNASEKIQNILQKHRGEFETLKSEAQDDTTGRWDKWGEKCKSELTNFIKEHLDTKSALTAALELVITLVGSEKGCKYIAENYKETWQGIVA
ncbi:hypothetical protein HY605_06115, partial [Candidatus Peregrinibacteria bacterium]|nr:hypothetical protein [Candidatus Peregrinibacteria bacterium]